MEKKKRKQNIKAEDFVLFDRFSVDLSQKTASHLALKNCSEVVRKGPRYTGIFATWTR